MPFNSYWFSLYALRYFSLQYGVMVKRVFKTRWLPTYSTLKILHNRFGIDIRYFSLVFQSVPWPDFQANTGFCTWCPAPFQNVKGFLKFNVAILHPKKNLPRISPVPASCQHDIFFTIRMELFLHHCGSERDF